MEKLQAEIASNATGSPVDPFANDDDWSEEDNNEVHIEADEDDSDDENKDEYSDDEDSIEEVTDTDWHLAVTWSMSDWLAILDNVYLDQHVENVY